MQCLFDIGPVALEKIFKFRQCIFAISLSPLEKVLALHLNKLESLAVTQGYLNVPSLVEVGPVVLEKIKM